MEVRVSELGSDGQRIEFVQGSALQFSADVVPAGEVAWNVSVTISSDRLQRATEEQLKKLSTRVKVPGFRPGKIPMPELRKRYGSTARYEAIDASLNLSMQQTLSQPVFADLVYYTPPQFPEPATENGGFSYTFVAERFPTVALTDYAGVSVERVRVVVSDEAVDAEIERKRLEASTIEPLEDRDTVQPGDLFTVTYEAADGAVAAKLGGRDELVDLSGDTVLPSFAAAVVGLVVGQETVVTISMPEDHRSTELAGQDVQLRVTVTGLKRRILPELDDEFARSLDEGDTFEELRANVRKRLTDEKEAAELKSAKARLLRAFVEAHPIPLPEKFVLSQARAEVENTFRQYFGKDFDFTKSNMDLTPFLSGATPRIEASLRSELLLLGVANAENITIAGADLQEWFEARAEEEQAPISKVRARFSKPEQLNNLMTRLRLDRSLEKLWSLATITEVDALTTPDPVEGGDDESDAGGEENGGSGE
jgi:trigger factor